MTATYNGGIYDLQTNPWSEAAGGFKAQVADWKEYYRVSGDTKRLAEFNVYVAEHYPAEDVAASRTPIADSIAEAPEDVVNHPSHYKTESGLEAIDVLEQFGLVRDGRLFNAGKYILRAGKKDDELQDLKKAVWFLNRYIAEAEAK